MSILKENIQAFNSYDKSSKLGIVFPKLHVPIQSLLLRAVQMEMQCKTNSVVSFRFLMHASLTNTLVFGSLMRKEGVRGRGSLDCLIFPFAALNCHFQCK